MTQGLEKEPFAAAWRNSSHSACCREALKTAAAFRVIASLLAAGAKIMFLAINYQEPVTSSIWMMNCTRIQHDQNKTSGCGHFPGCCKAVSPNQNPIRAAGHLQLQLALSPVQVVTEVGSWVLTPISESNRVAFSLAVSVSLAVSPPRVLVTTLQQKATARSRAQLDPAQSQQDQGLGAAESSCGEPLYNHKARGGIAERNLVRY